MDLALPNFRLDHCCAICTHLITTDLLRHVIVKNIQSILYRLSPISILCTLEKDLVNSPSRVTVDNVTLKNDSKPLYNPKTNPNPNYYFKTRVTLANIPARLQHSSGHHSSKNNYHPCLQFVPSRDIKTRDIKETLGLVRNRR